MGFQHGEDFVFKRPWLIERRQRGPGVQPQALVKGAMPTILLGERPAKMGKCSSHRSALNGRRYC